MNDVIQQFALTNRGNFATLTIGNLKVNVRFDRRVTSEEAFQESNGSLHNRYRVTLINTDTGARCSYHFHDSHANTVSKDIYPDDLGYSILACLKMDWYCTSDEYPTFRDFADNFGYDYDSRRAERIYKKAIKLGAKLKEIVSADLHDKLPD